MMGLKFMLDTTAREFANVLEREARTLWLREFPAGRGRLILQRANSDTEIEPTRVTIDGVYVRPTADGGESIDPMPGMIKFDLLHVSSQPPRVEVKVTSYEQAIAAYYVELLERIADLYSEAQSVILPYLRQVRAQMGIYQPPEPGSAEARGLAEFVTWVVDPGSEPQAVPGAGGGHNTQSITVFDEDCKATRDDVYGVVERFVLHYSASQGDVFRWAARREFGELRFYTHGLPVVVVEADRINDSTSHVRVTCLGKNPSPFYDYPQALSLSKAIRDELTRHYLHSRRLGFHRGYLRAAAIIAALAIIVSLILFPEWTQSVPLLVVLAVLVILTVVALIANWRQAFEISPDSTRHDGD